MPLPPQTVQIIVSYAVVTDSGQTKKLANGYIYQCGVPVTPLNKTDVKNIFKTTVLDGLKLNLCSNTAGEGLTVRQLESTTDPATAFAYTDVGSLGTPALSTDDCVSILLRTLLSGKNYKGAKRYGSIDKASTVSTELSVTAQGRWVTFLALLTQTLIDAGGNSWVPGIYSRNLSTVAGTTRTVVFTALDIPHCRVNFTLGTMRHRKEKTIGNIA